MFGYRASGLNGLSLVLIFVLVACSGGGGGGNKGANFEDGAIITTVTCETTANDSIDNSPSTWTRIHSESNGNPEYYSITLARQTLGVSGPSVTMDYMVHPSNGPAKALLVLIAGGALDAGIEGSPSTTTPNPPTAAGGIFVVRSAHLFAAQGYKVLTIDHPSDFSDYLNGGNSDYDNYRNSMAHAVDLSEVINIVNSTDNLPVILVGTSRGAISAVYQYQLAEALAISSPVTTGNITPVSNTLANKVSIPVQVSWHTLDTCTYTLPKNSIARLNEFPDAVGVAMSGGFSNPGADVCKGDSYHGFPGIESCAVQQTTDWIANVLTDLPTTRPVTTALAKSTAMDVSVIIDLAGAAAASNGGSLTYSIPSYRTSLGGYLSITGTEVTYIPPINESGITDTFVYIAKEQDGGTANNIVTVTIP